MEAVLGQQVIEVVARDPAREVFGISAANLVGVAVAEVLEPGVDLSRRPPAAMIRSSSSSLVAPTVMRVPS